ncbi:Tgt2/MlaC family protein [Pseudodesulfovibrio portus]|uniref:Toluene tolerance protein n=1 Tax=Pseudodesulfovibrio portus TaxID=231439 RepID=A0ABM8AR74_9BACT|nr:ABC transporter substrate-binding protein [Pseudodesulfovibrio portus]BDQ33917.1 toluene tolerance protein [Pseudodesulfovibrio portus]
MLVRRVLLSLLLVCIFSSAASPVLADQSPMERVQEGTEKLIAMLSDPDILSPENHEDAIARLRAVAEQYIDFGLVTKYAVGRPWLSMTPQMRTDLTEAFIKLLERSYLKRIPAYEGQEVLYKKEAVQDDKAKVLTEIIDKDKKIVVEFRLRIIQDKWMIYDIVAEGVSLVMNYRSQFSEVLSKGTPEDLLQLIRERIEIIDRQQQEEEQAS